MMLLTKYFGGQNGETIIASKSLDFPEQKSFFGHLKHIELHSIKCGLKYQEYQIVLLMTH